MSHPSLTIVLPVYNGESLLRRSVGELLELASELTRSFRILIVDDGSTDDTGVAAEELAARYPQVAVRHHRHRRGLGPTIEYVERRVKSDVVILHDGVTPIDPHELRRLWHEFNRKWSADQFGSTGSLRSDMQQLSVLPSIHAALEKAHAQVLGFHLLTPTSGEPSSAGGEPARPSGGARTDAAHTNRAGVGEIPPLPRPKFLTALAEFALGE